MANFLLTGHISASCHKSQVTSHFLRRHCTLLLYLIDRSRNVRGMFVAGYQEVSTPVCFNRLRLVTSNGGFICFVKIIRL